METDRIRVDPQVGKRQKPMAVTRNQEGARRGRSGSPAYSWTPDLQHRGYCIKLPAWTLNFSSTLIA